MSQNLLYGPTRMLDSVNATQAELETALRLIPSPAEPLPEDLVAALPSVTAVRIDRTPERILVSVNHVIMFALSNGRVLRMEWEPVTCRWTGRMLASMGGEVAAEVVRGWTAAGQGRVLARRPDGIVTLSALGVDEVLEGFQVKGLGTGGRQTPQLSAWRLEVIRRTYGYVDLLAPGGICRVCRQHGLTQESYRHTSDWLEAIRVPLLRLSAHAITGVDPSHIPTEDFMDVAMDMEVIDTLSPIIDADGPNGYTTTLERWTSILDTLRRGTVPQPGLSKKGRRNLNMTLWTP